MEWEDDEFGEDADLGTGPAGPDPFRKDVASFYSGVIEVRVLIDPTWVQLGDPFATFTQLLQVVRYARKVTVPTKIELLYPPHLEDRRVGGRISVFVRDPERRDVGPPREASSLPGLLDALAAARLAYESLKMEHLGAFAAGTHPPVSEMERMAYGMVLFDRHSGTDLLLLAKEHGCEFLLTDNPWLIEHAAALKAHGIWVGRPLQVIEWLQRWLRAAGVFIEAITPMWGVGAEGHGLGTFYHAENALVFKSQQWAVSLTQRVTSSKLETHVRGGFFHRLPFVLYAHDLVQHHADVAQRFTSEDRFRGDHKFHAAYHLNALYVMMAALLDNVAWIWNFYLDLGFKDSKVGKPDGRNCCVLTHSLFRAQVGKKHPEFLRLLEEKRITDWIKSITDLKRHPAVHREPLYFIEIVEQETGRVISESASLIEDSSGVRAFDIRAHAEEDVRSLFYFIARLIALPIPEPPTPSAVATTPPTKSK